MIELKTQEAKIAVAKLMADGYAIPESETLGMLGDAHATNYAENREFFLNQNNPTNFERTWNNAYFLYRRIGSVSSKTPFDQVMDFSVIQELASEPRYSSQTVEYQFQFAPSSASSIQAESAEILTKTIVIHFFPNSWDLKKMVTKNVDGTDREEFYDPNWKAVVQEVGELAGQYGAAHIVIEGHTDSSMKGRVSANLVKELASNRANAVKQALLADFPDLPPNQFAVSGMGWDRPADADDPDNHARNRRVEIKVYPAESAGD
jgi:outer membrane protein OmpA-like peptidoglycan-associated protein